MYTPYVSRIAPGVTLTCVETDKFKTSSLTFHLICPLSRETASMSALLPRVLRRGTSSLPDMRKLSEALDDLYGARISPASRKKGELHCVELYSDFLDDSCIPSGDSQILEKTVLLLGEMLFSPILDNGLLRKDYIDSEREKLIDDINAAINDKRGYSIDRLLEEMCSSEAYGVSSLGTVATALEITAESLTAHYSKLLKESRIDITYCGSAKPERIETAVKTAFKSLPDRSSFVEPKTDILIEPPADAPRRFTEKLDVLQGKLAVGFRIGASMRNPDYPALMVFNAVYGGAVTSKLFLNVREKLSLCYFANSMLEKHKGVMLVSSGVEFSKFDAALEEILAQLENIKNGDVTDFELDSAKSSLVTAVLSAMDRPSGLEDLYFDSAIASAPYSPGELCGLIEKVTRDDVVKIAKGIKTDSIYFLTGKEDCDNVDN